VLEAVQGWGARGKQIVLGGLALQRAPWLFDARAPQISRAKPRPQTQRTKPARSEWSSRSMSRHVRCRMCAVPRRARYSCWLDIKQQISHCRHSRRADRAIVPGKSEWRGSRLAHREATGALVCMWCFGGSSLRERVYLVKEPRVRSATRPRARPCAQALLCARHALSRRLKNHTQRGKYGIDVRNSASRRLDTGGARTQERSAAPKEI